MMMRWDYFSAGRFALVHRCTQLADSKGAARPQHMADVLGRRARQPEAAGARRADQHEREPTAR